MPLEDYKNKLHFSKLHEPRNILHFKGIPKAKNETSNLLSMYFKKICEHFDIKCNIWLDIKNIERISKNEIRVVLKENKITEQILEKRRNYQSITASDIIPDMYKPFYSREIRFFTKKTEYFQNLWEYLEECRRQNKLYKFRFSGDNFWIKLVESGLNKPIFCFKDIHDVLKLEYPPSGGHSKFVFEDILQLFGCPTGYKILCCFVFIILIRLLFGTNFLPDLIIFFVIHFYFEHKMLSGFCCKYFIQYFLFLLSLVISEENLISNLTILSLVSRFIILVPWNNT